MTKIYICLAIISLILLELKPLNTSTKLPIVAIANYGPHASLAAAIHGFKTQMIKEGFIEGKTVHYLEADVGFDQTLIPQMLNSLLPHKPKLILVVTTPIAQAAKASIHKVPLVYTAITDPVDAGLIQNENPTTSKITGSSDKQDLLQFLKFVHQLLPAAKRIGFLYANAESNDLFLLKNLTKSAHTLHMQVMAIPVDQAKDAQLCTLQFKDKVDFIYIANSGPILPSLPAISAVAKQLHLPLFEPEVQGVIDGLALASFGLDYATVGAHAGHLAALILQGRDPKTLAPQEPSPQDYHAMINRRLATEYQVASTNHAHMVD